ncbi:hypothetical protein U1Q18_039468 [Sarracenia purpurea var. burkii]
MLLGKRTRGSMIRRTTSMTGIGVDLYDAAALQPSADPPQNPPMNIQEATLGAHEVNPKRSAMAGRVDRRLMATVSPMIQRTVSGGAMETAPFLRTCGLCRRRLAPGRDIYMYRGDTAFCSLECREQQMKHDEKKEKCPVTAWNKDENHIHHHHSATPPPPPSPPATSEA